MSEPAAGNIGSSSLKVLRRLRRRIADGGGHDRDRPKSCWPSPTTLDADNQAHADNAEYDAEQFARGDRLGCVTVMVSRKVKIGAVELSTVASPASTQRSPQAINVKEWRC